MPNASIHLALHKTLITVVRVFSWPRELGWIVWGVGFGRRAPLRTARWSVAPHA